MSLQPLKPQSLARVAWESNLQAQLCSLGDMTNGDAQGLIEANAEEVEAKYQAWTAASFAALQLLDTITPDCTTVDGAPGEFHGRTGNVSTTEGAARIPSPLTVEIRAAGAFFSFAGLAPMHMNWRGEMPLDQWAIFTKRLAACFNACDGVSTGMLGDGGLLRVMKACAEAEQEREATGRANVHLTAALAEAREQRDSLEGEMDECRALLIEINQGAIPTEEVAALVARLGAL